MALEEEAGRLLLTCKDGNTVSVSLAAARKVPALVGLCDTDQNAHALPFQNAAAVARALRTLDADIPEVPDGGLGADPRPGGRAPPACKICVVF